MAVEKKTTRKTVKKTAVKKTAAAKKTPVQAPAAKKETVSKERFQAMVSKAAYFLAQNDGNRKSALDYWVEAEKSTRAGFDVA